MLSVLSLTGTAWAWDSAFPILRIANAWESHFAFAPLLGSRTGAHLNGKEARTKRQVAVPLHGPG